MPDLEQVIEANLKFYFALESLDIKLMDEVWTTDASAVCVHPGWSRLIGWEHVRESWERIFELTTEMRISVTDVVVEAHGNVAWITCRENITTTIGDQTRLAQAAATNVFTSAEEGWLMVLHHSSIISTSGEHAEEEEQL